MTYVVSGNALFDHDHDHDKRAKIAAVFSSANALWGEVYAEAMDDVKVHLKVCQLISAINQIWPHPIWLSRDLDVCVQVLPPHQPGKFYIQTSSCSGCNPFYFEVTCLNEEKYSFHNTGVIKGYAPEIVVDRDQGVGCCSIS